MGELEARADTAGRWTGMATRVGRDVAVNVLGNLVTAAVLYLVATSADALPRNRELITTALGVTFAAVLIWWLNWGISRGVRWPWLVGGGVGLILVVNRVEVWMGLPDLSNLWVEVPLVAAAAVAGAVASLRARGKAQERNNR